MRTVESCKMTVCEGSVGSEERECLVLHVSFPKFHPKGRWELYIRLLAEDSKQGHVEKLLRTFYGTRDAANAWDEFLNDAAIHSGHDIGLSSSCLHHRREEDSHGW